MKSFEQFPKARKFQDFRRMFDEMNSQIDGVVVKVDDHTVGVAQANVFAVTRESTGIRANRVNVELRLDRRRFPVHAHDPAPGHGVLRLHGRGGRERSGGRGKDGGPIV